MKIGLVAFFQDFRNIKTFVSGGLANTYALVREWKDMGAQVHIIGEKKNWGIYSNSILALMYLITKKYPIRLNREDILISSSPYPLEFLTFLKLLLTNDTHGFVYFRIFPPFPLWKPFSRGVIRSFVNYFYFILIADICKIFNVGVMLDQPQAVKLGTLKIIRTNNASEIYFDTEEYAEKDNDIFYIGRIQRSKGIIDIIHALRIVKCSGINLTAVIAGEIYDKRYFEKILKLIKKYQLDNIVFPGKISDKEKASLFKRSRCFVFPSYEDSWGISVTEAAGFKLPIVAYELPAYSYLQGNYNKVKPGDIHGLAESIIKCLKNGEEIKDYTDRAKSLVLTYSNKENAIFQLNKMLEYSGIKNTFKQTSNLTGIVKSINESSDPLQVSVVIIAYNRKQFILDAISSVLNQSLSRDKYEIIVVKNFEDQKIDRFIQENKIISVISRDHSLGSKLVDGIKISKAEVVSFLEDDDKFEFNKLETISNLFRSSNSLIYYHNAWKFVNNDGQLNYYNFQRHYAQELRKYRELGGSINISKDFKNLKKLTKFGIDWNCSSISIRKEFIMNYIEALHSINNSVDTFIWSVAVLNGGEMYIDDRKLTTVRTEKQDELHYQFGTTEYLQNILIKRTNDILFVIELFNNIHRNEGGKGVYLILEKYNNLLHQNLLELCFYPNMKKFIESNISLKYSCFLEIARNIRFEVILLSRERRLIMRYLRYRIKL